ncbi:MAG: hypothetical protein A2937_01970 [Candidatus Yonathbacteria bacterium RIFCSPLOWO2_01_FULL_47_33b]|uniref:SGNH hydrolase-type esterase domain-containing protein n=1 Tax=Candidatus Yonathbacteria bacterium RIFCSPLOWO2_01_FULL_47_33b TaxID=1802727 RepID=A0A1G2SG92_9BACT|nr:MAG: hypothetical protein A2937_01970 [Candidatus Yonathbacteria bacterium RIFCSPLOWO2_01_FULL_47_33b]
MSTRQVAFLGFAILILAPILYLVFRGDRITNYPPKNQTIVAFGDSLVEGVGSTAGNDFVSVVERTLGVSIANKGKSGDTTANGIARVDEVLAEDPGIVIVLLGGNDALRRISKQETFANLGTIIERFQSAGAVVVLLGVRGGILGDGYANEFEALAETYHMPYVSNVLEGLITNPKLMSDGIHPNDQGYAIVAERVIEILQEVLR